MYVEKQRYLTINKDGHLLRLCLGIRFHLSQLDDRYAGWTPMGTLKRKLTLSKRIHEFDTLFAS